MSVESLQIILVDPYESLCDEWLSAFSNFSNIEVINGVFEELEFDCIVTAANSFGLMDGGIDAAMIRFFGSHVQDRVQKHILKQFMGEQPVGTSFIVETESESHPFLAHTPTMRTPMDISKSINTYLAFRAALVEVLRFNNLSSKQIRTLACPGLGTAIGRMPHDKAAQQMATAYHDLRYLPDSLTWPHALKHKEVLSNSDSIT